MTTYDYMHYTHKPLALCSNDAKSCYDHIVLIVVALCLCHLGAPKTSVQSIVSTIQSTYGDSDISQGQAQWKDPIAGIDQGNGAGPHIWAAVSTPLFHILMKEGFLAQIICTISKHWDTMAGFCFMDDMDLCITDTSGNSKQVVK